MRDTSADLSSQLRELSSLLQRVQQRLHVEAPPQPAALSEFRQVVDNIRFTAWGVSELINARETNTRPEGIRAFLTAERLRRFEQLMRDLCSDLERQAISLPPGGNRSLVALLNTLQSYLDAGVAVPHLPRADRDGATEVR